MRPSKNAVSRQRALLDFGKYFSWLLFHPGFSVGKKNFLKKITILGHIFLQGGLQNNEDVKISRRRAELDVLKGNKKLNESSRAMKMVIVIGGVLGLACESGFAFACAKLEKNMEEFVGAALGFEVVKGNKGSELAMVMGFVGTVLRLPNA